MATEFGQQPSHPATPATPASHYHREGWLSFSTPNLYQYQDVGLDLSTSTSVVLLVQACNDAHIALSQHFEQYSSSTYEIVISGWSNTQSVIR